MSRNASVVSLSKSFMQGISPAGARRIGRGQKQQILGGVARLPLMMRQKRQAAMVARWMFAPQRLVLEGRWEGKRVEKMPRAMYVHTVQQYFVDNLRDPFT